MARQAPPYISRLAVFPGTHDFQDAERAGWSPRALFTEDFQESRSVDASDDTTALLNAWFAENKGGREGFVETTERCRATSAGW